MGNLGAQIYHSTTQLRPACPVFCQNHKLGITTTSIWVPEPRFTTPGPQHTFPSVAVLLQSFAITICPSISKIFSSVTSPPNWRRNPNKSAEQVGGLFFADFCTRSCEIIVKGVVAHVEAHRNPLSLSFVTKKFVVLFVCNEKCFMQNVNGWPNGHSTGLSSCSPGSLCGKMYHPLTTGPRFLEVAGVGGVTWHHCFCLRRFFFSREGENCVLSEYPWQCHLIQPYLEPSPTYLTPQN